ncbi:MAG: P-type conjugative transfer ATPase TrbB [Silvanigrellaceae bacterium]|nr:P-type conjugative transfer ATPase TrbB [Silvanigrellaceae bacterium]
MINKKHEDNWERLKFDLGNDLLPYLENPSVVEIMLNPDGNVWIEKLGESMEMVGKIRYEKASMIINTMASSLDTIINADNPIVGGEIPVEGSRFEAMIPPVVIAPCFSIRKKAVKIFSLNEYVDLGIMTLSQSNIIEEVIKIRKNILIVGATSSGKTTFANAILKKISEIDSNCRMAIIEDTRELQCDIKNKLVARSTKKILMQDLLKSIMRFRPDRICVGEVRSIEAFTLLMAWNTGHCGGIATVHANNAKAGIKKIEQILMAHQFIPVPDMIAEAINIVINIQKTKEGRRIKEILEVSCLNGEYLFKEIY